MQPLPTIPDDQEHLPSLLAADAQELSYQLQLHQQKIFQPLSQKTIRAFTPAEASAFIGIGEGYLRQVAADGHGPEPLSNGRRLTQVALSDSDKGRGFGWSERAYGFLRQRLEDLLLMQLKLIG